MYSCTGEEIEVGGKRRRVTPAATQSLGHLCSVAAALSSDSASPAPRLASSTPDACEAVQQPQSCPSPSCPDPELLASTGEDLSSASSSDLDSSSPDSCYEQAFICDGIIGPAVPADASQVQPPAYSIVQRQALRPCSAHAPAARAARHRRPLGQGEVYRFGQGMQLRSSRLSVPGAPRECQRTRSSVARHTVTRGGPAQPAATEAGVCGSGSPSAPCAPAATLHSQPAAAALRAAALQVATSLPEGAPAPAGAAHSSRQLQAGLCSTGGGDTTVAVANLMAGHSLARLPPAQLALLIANHNGSDPVLTQALQCAMAALSDAQLGAVGCASPLCLASRTVFK